MTTRPKWKEPGSGSGWSNDGSSSNSRRYYLLARARAATEEFNRTGWDPDTLVLEHGHLCTYMAFLFRGEPEEAEFAALDERFQEADALLCADRDTRIEWGFGDMSDDDARALVVSVAKAFWGAMNPRRAEFEEMPVPGPCA